MAAANMSSADSRMIYEGNIPMNSVDFYELWITAIGDVQAEGNAALMQGGQLFTMDSKTGAVMVATNKDQMSFCTCGQKLDVGLYYASVSVPAKLVDKGDYYDVFWASGPGLMSPFQSGLVFLALAVWPWRTRGDRYPCAIGILMICDAGPGERAAGINGQVGQGIGE